jgi:hypothetical protein
MTPGLFTRRMTLAILLLAAAALLRFVLAPRLHDLPVDYTLETRYTAESRFRDSPDGEWQNVDLIARRVDQTQVNAGQVAVIQGNLFWFTDSGQVIFENSGLYGVDRRTRLNVSSYGDTERAGYFFFPPHIEPADFTFWDPMFIGSRQAIFDHVETLDGLQVYVFLFSGVNMDETVGYSYLPIVPERYHALTDGQGTLWIEPLSGLLVDYEEQGTSYFVDIHDGQRIANFYEWSDRYTPETRTAQLSQARLARLRILVLETWMSLGLALAGLGFLGWDLYRRRVIKRASS